MPWILLLLGVLHLAWVVATNRPPVVDFPHEFWTASALWHRSPDPFPEVQVWPGVTTTNINTPHFHLLLWPLLPLGMDRARWAWQFANLLGIWLAVRIIGVKPRATWCAAFVWCGGGTTALLVLGQMAGVFAPVVSMAWLEVDRRRWHRAALWLGLMASVKPFFGLLVAWLLFERKWKAFGLAVVTTVAIYGLGITVLGLSSYEHWLGALRRSSELSWLSNSLNGSLAGLATRLLPGLARRVFWLGTALTVVTYSAVRLPQISISHRLVVVVVCAVLISPIGWGHYLWLFVGPLVAWLSAGNRWPPVAWLLWISPFWMEASGQIGFPGWSLPSAYTYGFLALWLGLLRTDAMPVAVRESVSAQRG
jgi:hypothetical protein